MYGQIPSVREFLREFCKMIGPRPACCTRVFPGPRSPFSRGTRPLFSPCGDAGEDARGPRRGSDPLIEVRCWPDAQPRFATAMKCRRESRRKTDRVHGWPGQRPGHDELLCFRHPGEAVEEIVAVHRAGRGFGMKLY